ncbi:hypothetical protein J1N35_038739 [Gossypium stocksii]|uniref:Transmembrane protein n=1 Tax=Gossypium stocksii TaxID=47602 RepID=A0A9D3UN18_9ROSI|nr:hypothetical protein J1N35_038739 [Gossypium stocksii]
MDTRKMEMLTPFAPSPHHFYSFSKSLIFPPRFHPLSPSLPVRLRSFSPTRSPRCLSAGSPPPSPPDSDPPGLEGKLSRFQDRARIFFAVLFWMSLFFWSSSWDGRNTGKPNKGSRFRR